MEKGVVKNFANFTRKHLSWNFFFKNTCFEFEEYL